MTNMEIAWIFNEIADLLEIKDEHIFKTRSYRRAANTLQRMSIEVKDLERERWLRDLPGIGERLADKIEEILETGRCAYLEMLREQVPQGLRDMLAIPGLGAKTVRFLHCELAVKNLGELEKAVRSQKVRKMRGMGSKTEKNILAGIEMLKTTKDYFLLGVALPVGELLIKFLSSLPYVDRAELSGEVRRGKELVSGLEILVASKEPEKVLKVFVNYPHFRESWLAGPFEAYGINFLGIKVHLEVIPPQSFVAAWFYNTASQNHRRELEKIAKARGYLFSREGFKQGENLTRKPQSEEEIYELLDLAYIPPEIREGRGEIKQAKTGQQIKLVQIENIRGDLHVHTDWSDGANSLEEMVEAAYKKGYDYIAITDHSCSLKVARGLSLVELERQFDAIEKLKQKFKGLKLLTGTEVDIRLDGTLDYPDELLERADVVIASIHSGFKQEASRLNYRVEKALENPHVDIFAHPSGRILGKRPPYALDLERLLEIAVRTGTWLEINSSPDRLDLNDEWVRKAVAKGVRLVINTDAHNVGNLDDMRFGVITARRGGLKDEDVVNTWSVSKLLGVLREKS